MWPCVHWMLLVSDECVLQRVLLYPMLRTSCQTGNDIRSNGEFHHQGVCCHRWRAMRVLSAVRVGRRRGR